MAHTLVIQSHRSPLPHDWIEPCLASVRDWCAQNEYQYQFMGDELFDFLPEAIRKKTLSQRVIASDLARLRVLQEALDKGYEAVVWMDADFLVFDPSGFSLPAEPCALGREVWVQHDSQGRLRSYKKVHNAFLMFRRGNSFLDFYADTARRLLVVNNGQMSPQFIGPKLLTALHNLAGLPVLETAGMLSPMVIEDILNGDGPALALFRKQSPAAIAAANLCISSCARGEVADKQMERLIDTLLASAGRRLENRGASSEAGPEGQLAIQ